MKSSRAKGVIAVLIVITVSAILGTVAVRSQAAKGAPTKTPEQMNKEEIIKIGSVFNFPDYTKIPTDEAEQQTAQVLEQRTVATSKLIMRVEEPQTSKVAKAEIIYLLGALRAPEAVTALIENINFFDDRVIAATRDSDRGGYIARRALAHIGEPSARWIYLILSNDHNLETANFDKSQVDGFVEVLSGIETPELALIKLQRGLAKAKDAIVKAQYEMVIHRLREKMPREG